MILAGLAVLLLVGLILLGMPMVIAVAATVTVYLLMVGQWPLAFPQQVVDGMDGFILLALPLFILAGGLMNAGGLSGRIFEFARALVGQFRGGLGHVNVATSMFFGGFIGTSVADLAGSGSVIIPEMKRNGYRADVSAAISASSSGIGVLIPPSSPLILYSAVTGTSLGALFLAGLIPGILLGLSQMLIIFVLSRRRGWGSYAQFSWATLRRSFGRAVLAIGMPVIIVGGLVFGVFTPTEAGAFAVAYAVILAFIVYRSVSLRDLYRIAVNATALTGEVMLIVGVSVALGRFLSGARVPQKLGDAIAAVTPGDNVTLKIAGMLILAMVAGMILDPLIPIVLPILLPALVEFDINQLHFAVLIVIAVVIGQVTPPVALCLVVAGKIGRVDLWDAFRANMPFLAGMVVLLVGILLVPGLATWLPSVLGS